METSAPAAIASRPVSNNALSVQNNSDMPASSTSASPSGFLGAPTALRSGVLEDTRAATPVTRAPATTAAHLLAVTPAATPIGNSNGRYLVQVGALSDPLRAQTWLKSLSERFHVTGKVTPSNGLYRVQLGPFQNHQQATELQQRLATEAQQHAFVTAADAQ
uniref:SPOR domain-containing protein n=2 Tax=cellular organisms TaxID=131567 RepID=T1I9N7_RHOPR